MRFVTLILLTYLVGFSCSKNKNNNTVEAEAISGVFNSVLIVPCKLIQSANGSYHIVTTGNKPVKNSDFELVAITGSFNSNEIKKSALFNEEHADFSGLFDLLLKTNQSAGSYPELEQEIAVDFKKNSIATGNGKVQLLYRIEGVKNLRITSLEPYRGLPPGSDITGQGYLFEGIPPLIISSETKKLLYGFNKQPDYSPLYQGFGQIKDWLALKPTVPPMIRLKLPMHSETYGDFSFVVSIETDNNKIISDTCKVTLLQN